MEYDPARMFSRVRHQIHWFYRVGHVNPHLLNHSGNLVVDCKEMGVPGAYWNDSEMGVQRAYMTILVEITCGD